MLTPNQMATRAALELRDGMSVNRSHRDSDLGGQFHPRWGVCDAAI
jgi:hypothetical protein